MLRLIALIKVKGGDEQKRVGYCFPEITTFLFLSPQVGEG
jgi:hypothetical protein